MKNAHMYLSLMIILVFMTSVSAALALRQESVRINKKHSENPEKIRFVPGEVIVKFKENKDASSITYPSNSFDIKSDKRIINANERRFREKGLDRLHLLKVNDVEKTIMELRNNPDVDYAEPNYIVSVAKIPNDANFSQLYGLHNTGQSGGKIDADIDAPEGWNIQTGNKKVIVAVIDTGVDYNHADLARNMWINAGEIPNNGIDDDHNGFIDDYRGWNFVGNTSDPFDDYGHGTHVAGTIGAAGDNGIGVTGVNWNVTIMPVKFLDSGGSGTIESAILSVQYATLMHADIMSNSWGGGGFSLALRDAIEAANNAGILFVAAAGNSAQDNDATPFYPASYDNSNVIAVAATDANDEIAGFSNYGASSVDVAAPGVGIFSTVPNGTCPICSASGYTSISGTSMATPHVSGVAALIKAQYPLASVSQIKSRILNSVDHLTNLDGRILSGGRINAYNALENDAIPPSAILDLTPGNKSQISIALGWTSVGDDNSIGTAASYDIRYSKSLISEANFENAAEFLNSINPKPAGYPETAYVDGLSPNTTYHFAIKAVDNVGNIGQVSNIATGTTMPLQGAAPPYYDDFESGKNGWTSTGLWHLEITKSNSPATSWTYNTGSPNFNYNSPSLTGGLTSPFIDLTNKKNALLRFKDYYQTEANDTFYDQRWIRISINASPFSNLIQLSGEPMNLWHSHEISLNAYAGNFVRIQFYFDAIDTILNDYWGWSVDDFNISAFNNPPTANAGPDKTLTDFDGDGFETATLSGSGFDADGSISSYEWREGALILGTSSSLTYSFGLGTHNLTLTVTDDGGLNGLDNVLVIVKNQSKKTQVFFDDLQSQSFAKWTESNEFDWNVETPSEKNITGSPALNFVAHADKCTSSGGCILTMKSYLNLSGFRNVTLSFFRYIDNDLDNGEYLSVEAYNGSKWTALAKWSNGSGDDDTWHMENFDLKKYLVKNFKIRFISKESSSSEDTEIDDVLIEGTPK